MPYNPNPHYGDSYEFRGQTYYWNGTSWIPESQWSPQAPVSNVQTQFAGGNYANPPANDPNLTQIGSSLVASKLQQQREVNPRINPLSPTTASAIAKTIPTWLYIIVAIIVVFVLIKSFKR